MQLKNKTLEYFKIDVHAKKLHCNRVCPSGNQTHDCERTHPRAENSLFGSVYT